MACQGQAVLFRKRGTSGFVLARCEQHARGLLQAGWEEVPRVVVDVHIHNLRPGTVYFHTELWSGKDTRLHPTNVCVLLSTARWSVQRQDGLRVWARAQVQRNPEVAQLLRGDATICIAMGPVAELRDLLGHHYDVPSVRLLALDSAGLTKKLALHRGRPALVVALMSDPDKFRVDPSLLVSLSHCSPVFLVVVVRWATEAATIDLLRAAQRSLPINTRLVDLITDVPPAEISPRMMLKPTLRPMPAHGFLRVPYAATEPGLPSDAELVSWLRGECQPSLELLFSGQVPLLDYVRALRDDIYRLLASVMSSATGGTHEVVLLKQMCRSGATSALRMLAVELAKMQLSVWLAAADEQCDQEAEEAWLRGVSPAVLLFDEADFEICTRIQRLVQRLQVSAVVVRVGVNPRQAELTRIVPVDPFLSPADVLQVSDVLKRSFPHAGDALGVLSRHASSAAADRFDSHLIVFGLTALRGAFAPAAKLAMDVVAEITSLSHEYPNMPIVDLIQSLAYLGSFSTKHQSAAVPCTGAFDPSGPVFQQLPLLRSLLTDFGDDTVAFAHPLLARLVLLQMMRGEVAVAPDPLTLVDLHAAMGRALAFVPMSRKQLCSRASMLAVEDRADHVFTALVAQFAYAQVENLTKACAMVASLRELLVCESWPVDPGNVELLLSRVVRQWTYSEHTESFRPALIQLAVDVARSAHKVLGSLDSLCNLAKVLALSGSVKGRWCPGNQNAIEANELMHKLFNHSAEGAESERFKIKATLLAQKHVPDEPAWKTEFDTWHSRVQALGLPLDRTPWNEPTFSRKLGELQFVFGGLYK
jgi:hypothetical protein